MSRKKKPQKFDIQRLEKRNKIANLESFDPKKYESLNKASTATDLKLFNLIKRSMYTKQNVYISNENDSFALYVSNQLYIVECLKITTGTITITTPPPPAATKNSTAIHIYH